MKKKLLLITTISILSIGVVYFLYTNMNIKTYDPDSNFIKNLVQRYIVYTSKYANYLYEKDKTDVSNLDQEYIKLAAINYIMSNNKDIKEFSKDDVERSAKTLFTKYSKIKHESIRSCNNFYFVYDKETGMYKDEPLLKTNCIDVPSYNLYSKIVNAKKNNNKIKVDVVVAYSTMNGVYKDVKLKEKISSQMPTDFKIEKYVDKLSKYRYNFSYSPNNNNYTLDSVELVK